MPKLILLSQNFVEFNMFILTASTHDKKGCDFHFPKEEQRPAGCACSVPEQKQHTAPQSPTLTGLMARCPELVHPEPAILLASACAQLGGQLQCSPSVFTGRDRRKKIIHIHPQSRNMMPKHTQTICTAGLVGLIALTYEVQSHGPKHPSPKALSGVYYLGQQVFQTKLNK